MFTYIKDFLSVIENKSSLIVALTTIFSGLAMWQLYMIQNIDTNLMYLILAGYTVIGGINVTNRN